VPPLRLRRRLLLRLPLWRCVMWWWMARANSGHQRLLLLLFALPFQAQLRKALQSQNICHGN
jgi:hypothetical protein